MFNAQNPQVRALNAKDATARWELALELTSMFAQIWLQNPRMAKQAGRRVEEFVMLRADVQNRHLNDLV